MSDPQMNGKAPDQWALINRMLLIYKVAAVGLSLGVAISGGLAVMFAHSDPIVVMESCGEKILHDGRREKPKITDDDVKSLIEQWIKLRYTWREFDPEKIAATVAPLSTEGLQEKLKAVLGKQGMQATASRQGTTLAAKSATPPAGSNAFRNQSVQQSVVNIEITLGEHEAVASFDRVIRIGGIPFVLPSQVAFQIIQGPPTHWNSLGLYVNGVIEKEER